MILVRWGFLEEDDETTGGKHIKIKACVYSRFEKRLRNLKIYNIDKDVVCDEEVSYDANDNEKRFRAWLSKQYTINGTLCSQSMISNNCSALNKVCQMIEVEEYPDLTSIFDILDLDVFLDVKDKIKSNPNYTEVNKACNNRFLSTGLAWYEKYLKEINSTLQEEENIDFDQAERIRNGENIILYGVPGAGKSWTVKNYYCDEDTHMERVVFHPDFTYSDFVGQIMPTSENGDVSYKFIPGPFTKIVKESYRNPMQKYILVIEEINRGNAPAIFGDIFQLLDRNEEGASEYRITNADIAKEVFGIENKEVFLPSNLSIICTMNTSDQNVFTLDTAFQRRWNMRLIENTFKKETPAEREFAEHPILDTTVSWEFFCNTINNQILEKNQNMTSSEDKRLGTHFVNLEDLVYIDVSTATDDKEKKAIELKNGRFPEKVIKYLWDDAFKFYRDEIFRGDLNSLEKVIKVFTDAKGNERYNIFKDNIKNLLLPSKIEV